MSSNTNSSDSSGEGCIQIIFSVVSYGVIGVIIYLVSSYPTYIVGDDYNKLLNETKTDCGYSQYHRYYPRWGSGEPDIEKCKIAFDALDTYLSNRFFCNHLYLFENIKYCKVTSSLDDYDQTLTFVKNPLLLTELISCNKAEYYSIRARNFIGELFYNNLDI